MAGWASRPPRRRRRSRRTCGTPPALREVGRGGRGRAGREDRGDEPERETKPGREAATDGAGVARGSVHRPSVTCAGCAVQPPRRASRVWCIRMGTCVRLPPARFGLDSAALDPDRPTGVPHAPAPAHGALPMTAEPAAHQDHLRDAAQRQRGAARAYEAGLEKARRGSGQHHRNSSAARARDGDGTFEMRTPIDRDIARRARSPRAPARTCRTRSPPRARPSRPGRARLAGAPGDPASRRRAHQRAPDGVRRADGHRGGQEPARGAGRGRGDGGPASASTRRRSSDNGFYDHPMDNLGDAAVHTRSILRPYGVFAVISPFNFPMALAAGPSARAAGRQHGRLQAGVGAPLSGVELTQAYRDAGVPDGVVQPGHGPRRHGRRRAPGEPGHRRHRLHRLVRGRVRPVPGRSRPTLARGRASSRWAARTRPSSRASADLEEAAEGDHALRVRVRRPEVLGEHAASTSSGRSTTSSSGCSSRRPRRSRSATRSSARTGSARSSTRRRSTATSRRSPRRAATATRVHRRRAPDRRRAGPRLLRRADGRRRPARPTTACSATSCSRRSPRSQAVDSLDEALRSPTTRSTA